MGKINVENSVVLKIFYCGRQNAFKRGTWFGEVFASCLRGGVKGGKWFLWVLSAIHLRIGLLLGKENSVGQVRLFEKTFWLSSCLFSYSPCLLRVKWGKWSRDEFWIIHNPVAWNLFWAADMITSGGSLRYLVLIFFSSAKYHLLDHPFSLSTGNMLDLG